MTRRQSLKAETVKIFEKLQCAKEYRNGFAPAKLRIIMRLLAVKHELHAFAQTPGRRPHEINGFFMEYCTRFSYQIPKNTTKGTCISEAIIDYLKRHELCNPDYIWLRTQGKRITLTGIGEVKSHPFNTVHKPSQLFLQEANIRNLIEDNILKSIISQRYHVTLAENFSRYLILPRSIDTPHILPAVVPLGWKVEEIEFTLPEIIFLKDLLLTGISQPDSPSEYIPTYSLEEYQMFTSEIIKIVEGIIIELLHNLFPVDQENIRNALTVWSLLWNSIPTNQESVDITVQWMHNIKQKNICALSLLSTPPLLLAQLDGEENASRDSFLRYADDNSATLIHALLSRLQEVRQSLPDPPKLSKKQEVNLFALL